jgi:hypothetical protein
MRARTLVQTSANPPAFRMEVEDDCWNFNIDRDTLTGLWNGGRCSSAGVGSASRLVALAAKRLYAVKR